MNSSEMPSTTHERFCAVCVAVSDSATVGTLTRKEAAYAIAGLLNHVGVRTNLRMRAISQLAAELELPDQHINGDPSAKWEDLMKMIHEYCNDSWWTKRAGRTS